MNKKVLLSKEGLEKLKVEYEQLTTVGRREVAAKIAEAKSYGDLRENSEYEDARNEQAQLELRILEVKDQIDNAEIITKSTSKNLINIGSSIELENLTTSTKEAYEIVGSMEADVFNGKISNESPLGSALIEKAVGDVVKFKAPKGQLEYKVLKIS